MRVPNNAQHIAELEKQGKLCSMDLGSEQYAAPWMRGLISHQASVGAWFEAYDALTLPYTEHYAMLTGHNGGKFSYNSGFLLEITQYGKDEKVTAKSSFLATPVFIEKIHNCAKNNMYRAVASPLMIAKYNQDQAVAACIGELLLNSFGDAICPAGRYAGISIAEILSMPNKENMNSLLKSFADMDVAAIASKFKVPEYVLQSWKSTCAKAERWLRKTEMLGKANAEVENAWNEIPGTVEDKVSEAYQISYAFNKLDTRVHPHDTAGRKKGFCGCKELSFVREEFVKTGTGVKTRMKKPWIITIRNYDTDAVKDGKGTWTPGPHKENVREAKMRMDDDQVFEFTRACLEYEKVWYSMNLDYYLQGVLEKETQEQLKAGIKPAAAYREY